MSKPTKALYLLPMGQFEASESANGSTQFTQNSLKHLKQQHACSCRPKVYYIIILSSVISPLAIEVGKFKRFSGWNPFYFVLYKLWWSKWCNFKSLKYPGVQMMKNWYGCLWCVLVCLLVIKAWKRSYIIYLLWFLQYFWQGSINFVPDNDALKIWLWKLLSCSSIF